MNSMAARMTGRVGRLPGSSWAFCVAASATMSSVADPITPADVTTPRPAPLRWAPYLPGVFDKHRKECSRQP